METKTEVKLFAFKLADAKSAKRVETSWKVRDGIANAGVCTGFDGDVRYRINPKTDGQVRC